MLNTYKKSQLLNKQPHCRIAKYCFPIYSHPAFRAQVKEKKYVEEHVDRALHDEQLLRVLNQQVDAYLTSLNNPEKDGISPAIVNDTDVEKILEQVLTLYQANQAVDSCVEGEASRSDVSSIARFELSLPGPESSIEGLHSSVDICKNSRMNLTSSAHDVRGRKMIHPKKWLPHHSRLPPLSIHATRSEAIPPFTAVDTRNYRLLPDLSPDVVPAKTLLALKDISDDFSPFSTDSEASKRERGGKRKSVGGPAPPARARGKRNAPQGPPIARDSVRRAIYSLLRNRADPAIAEGAAAPVGEAEIRRARAALRAVDALHLDDGAFARMDVLMDGNSTCIRRRKKPTAAPPQRAFGFERKPFCGGSPF